MLSNLFCNNLPWFCAILLPLSTCIFFREGERWYKLRAVLNKRMLHPKDSVQYETVVNEVVTDFIKRIYHIRKTSPTGDLVENLSNELYRFSLEGIDSSYKLAFSDMYHYVTYQFKRALWSCTNSWTSLNMWSPLTPLPLYMNKESHLFSLKLGLGVWKMKFQRRLRTSSTPSLKCLPIACLWCLRPNGRVTSCRFGGVTFQDGRASSNLVSELLRLHCTWGSLP